MLCAVEDTIKDVELRSVPKAPRVQFSKLVKYILLSKGE
jgi:hypothetical protein